MTEKTYLDQLAETLSFLPPEELRQALAGVRALGVPSGEAPPPLPGPPPLQAEPTLPKPRKPLEKLLLVLGAPLWLPLMGVLLAAAGLLFLFFWAVPAVVLLLALGLALAGTAAVAMGIRALFLRPEWAPYLLAGGAAAWGLALLLTLLGRLLLPAAGRLTRALGKALKRLLTGRHDDDKGQ